MPTIIISVICGLLFGIFPGIVLSRLNDNYKFSKYLSDKKSVYIFQNTKGDILYVIPQDKESNDGVTYFTMSENVYPKNYATPFTKYDISSYLKPWMEGKLTSHI